MKYIRTKDGIYEPTEWQCDLSGEMILVKANNKFGNDKVFAIDIINQADTIEELCDVYVIRLKNREIPIMETPRKGIRPRPSYFNIGECSFEKGYGAIWTEWGLKYVAKMNDKGELELL